MIEYFRRKFLSIDTKEYDEAVARIDRETDRLSGAVDQLSAEVVATKNMRNEIRQLAEDTLRVVRSAKK